MERCPGAAGDVDHLVDRREQAVPLVPHVRNERRSRPRRLLGHGDELLRGRVGAGEVDEPEGQHPRPCVEAEPDLAAHRPQRLGGRPDASSAEHDVPHGAVADRGDERDRGPGRVERVEVLRHCRPRPLLRARSLERSQVGLPLRAPGGVDGRGREAVGIDHLRREALRELRDEEGIVEGAKRRMRVEVDETGAQQQPGPVHDLACFRPPLRFVTLRHKLDLAVAGTDRALKRRRVAGVDGRAVDEEVEVRHRAAALRRGGEPRRKPTAVSTMQAPTSARTAPKPGWPRRPAARMTPPTNPTSPTVPRRG